MSEAVQVVTSSRVLSDVADVRSATPNRCRSVHLSSKLPRDIMTRVASRGDDLGFGMAESALVL